MFRKLFGAGLAASLLLSAGPALAAPVDLTILHTNDTHDHLEPFDSKKHGADTGGVARRATLFQRVKAQTKNVLLLDAGDVFQGTPLFTFFSGEPDYLTMAMAGYDAIAVGNHDMDNGLDNLLKQSKLLKHPPLSANLFDAKGKRLFPSHQVFERGGLKIAVIGAMSKNAFHAIADAKRVGVRFQEPLTVLRPLVAELRKTSDLVILLTHVGHEEEVALAKALPDVDLVVGGHSHTKVDHPVEVKHPQRTAWVGQAFQWGEYVGRMDLVVDERRIAKFQGGLLPVTPDIPKDPAVMATLAKYSAQIDAQMAQVVGQAAVAFENTRKSEGDTPLGNVIADAVREVAKTDVAIVNSGGIRAPIPQGPITRGTIYSVLPFENRLVKFQADAAWIQALADFTASRLGKNGSLQLSGVSFVVRGEKAGDVKVNGAPLDAKRHYSVSTIDYLADANDGATIFKQVKSTQALGVLIRDAFMQYLKAHPVLEEPQGGRFRREAPVGAHQ